VDKIFKDMIKTIQRLQAMDPEEVFEFDLSGVKRANTEIEKLERSLQGISSSRVDEVNAALSQMA
jgi:hypothetical protein